MGSDQNYVNIAWVAVTEVGQRYRHSIDITSDARDVDGGWVGQRIGQVAYKNGVRIAHGFTVERGNAGRIIEWVRVEGYGADGGDRGHRVRIGRRDGDLRGG